MSNSHKINFRASSIAMVPNTDITSPRGQMEQAGLTQQHLPMPNKEEAELAHATSTLDSKHAKFRTITIVTALYVRIPSYPTKNLQAH
jgi:hypothetical protein